MGEASGINGFIKKGHPSICVKGTLWFRKWCGRRDLNPTSRKMTTY